MEVNEKQARALYSHNFVTQSFYFAVPYDLCCNYGNSDACPMRTKLIQLIF